MASTQQDNSGWLVVRRSPVHGLGAFATRRIDKGARIIEYLGERVSHEEADRRYEHKDAQDSHTFLFIVDEATVIDAGVDGNEARFLNHSCEPNCESVIEGRRVFIEALVAIEAGAELTYDYQIQREDDDPEDVDEVFACRCGFPACRRTMLWPAERKRGTGAKRAGAKRGEVGKRTGAGKRTNVRTRPNVGKRKKAGRRESAPVHRSSSRRAGRRR
jgi:hypothetical protein